MEFQIEFNYQGSNTIIQCNTKDTMKDKFQSFLNKSKKDLNSVYFLYNGNIIEGTKTIEQISNKPDLERRKMTILVFDNEEDEENEKMLVKPKDISCPKCGEPAKINLSEFKLFFQCKKGHNTGNILLSDYKDSQKVDISKILCGKCKSVNKANSYEHMFFRCLTCKIDLCPMCKSTHEKDHDVIDYEEKNYICEKHNKYFSSYCETCKKNTCIFCEKEHHEVKVEDENEEEEKEEKEEKEEEIFDGENHKFINFVDISPNMKDVNKNLKDLKDNIDKFKGSIDELITKLQKIKDNIDYFYDINQEIAASLKNKNMNYEILYNYNKINESKLFDDIYDIAENKINEDNIQNLFIISEQISSKFKDEITIEYYNKGETIKLFDEDFVSNNKDNCKIVIEDKEYELLENFETKNLKNKDNDIVQVKLKGISNISNMCCMFYECPGLNTVNDISDWNT